MINEKYPSEGIKLTYDGGNMCSQNESYGLEISINCNMNPESFLAYTIDLASLSNPCRPRIQMSSKHGCPVAQSNTLTKFFIRFYYFIAVPLTVIGIWLLIMGGRNPTVSLMILTTAIVGTVLVVWIYEKVWTFVPEWTVFLAIYFAFGMGAGLGLGATM